MKQLFSVILLVIGAVGQSSQTFHHCTWFPFAGAGNSPHLYDTSKVYKCDEGTVEISGQWNETIEHGYVYTTDLGEPGRFGPHKVSESDYEWAEWCPAPTESDPSRKVRCGSKAGKCFDGKPATWDAAWQGYSCATPDHK